MSTIYALASARGKAGLSVVRISGPEAFAALERLVGVVPAPRHFSRRKIRWQGEALDDALVVRFEKGASFTGEETVELHLHGGQATVSAVLRALSEQDGLRMAVAGEFTRRAFENGVMSLAEVEGLADLIEAETEVQRKQALVVLSGVVGQLAEGWRTQLVRAVSLLEATIDFADEDIPFDVAPDVIALIEAVLTKLRPEIAHSVAAERVREGFEVAIVGAPNVGKSTLLNALAGREAAITSARAGTTRDVIEVRMDIAGFPVTLLDTAGLRTSDDEVEMIGIARAIDRATRADLRIFLVLSGHERTADLNPLVGDIVVGAKADLSEAGGFSVSGVTGEGIEILLEKIAERLSALYPADGVLTRERHRLAALDAIEGLESALMELRSRQGQIEVASFELRRALRALEALVGRVDVEDFLGEIFSSFCIGK